MKRLRILVCILSVAVAAPFVPAIAAPEVGRYVVTLNRDSNPEAIAREHGRKYGAKADRYYRSAIKGYVATIPQSRVDELRSDRSVVSVNENYMFSAAQQTLPTGVNRVDAEVVPGTGEGIHVAVLDSGIDYTHPDLAANFAGGVDCQGDDNGNYLDENGHGTHVAGILGAIDNTIGVVGVAPKARLWAVRILDENGNGLLEDILCGLEWVYDHAASNGIKIVNMSLEAAIPNADDENCGNDDGDPVHGWICLLVNVRGVTVVVAAGNHSDDIQDVAPAAYDEVIAVTALVDYDGEPCSAAAAPPSFESDDTFWDFSSFASTAEDKFHTIGAPGAYNIYSTVPGNDYDFSTGTSMAAPHVAGAAARYLQTHPGAAPSEVLSVLKTNGEPKNTNFQGDCAGLTPSHTDPSGDHPEPVVRVVDWEIDPEVTTPGIVRGNKWFLNNGFDANADKVFNYGLSTDKIVVGDWDGDGDDTPGIVRGNTWFLNDDLDPFADTVFNYGSSTDRPIVGDWDNDGRDEPGIVRGNKWFLNDDLDPNADHVFLYGSATDKIVAGDWDDDGFDEPGIVRGNQWFVNYDLDPNANFVFSFGATTDVPIAGDWVGDGKDRPGIHRSNKWFLNLGLDQSAEIVFPYGLPSDRFLVGDWDGENP